jgi:hypothetical protein
LASNLCYPLLVTAPGCHCWLVQQCFALPVSIHIAVSLSSKLMELWLNRRAAFIGNNQFFGWFRNFESRTVTLLDQPAVAPRRGD